MGSVSDLNRDTPGPLMCTECRQAIRHSSRNLPPPHPPSTPGVSFNSVSKPALSGYGRPSVCLQEAVTLELAWLGFSDC